jgi:release factor glutamine methyltransferase
MNYEQVLANATKILKNASILSSKLDCEVLLSNVLKIKRENLLVNLNKKINHQEFINFNKLINRRKKNEPVAYIVGYKEFWNEKFKVNSNVLIPRPDTEILVEEVIKFIQINSSLNILDIGTGTGCVILSVLNERKKCYGIGLDISKKAINIAKHNAKIQQLKNRIKFINSSIDKFCVGKYDLIISNPPYIKSGDIKDLDKGVSFYEPETALNGGCDGYSKIREIIYRSSALIKKKGKLFLEIGYNQKSEVIRILNCNKFYVNKVVKDLGKNNRCIISTKIL